MQCDSNKVIRGCDDGWRLGAENTESEDGQKRPTAPKNGCFCWVVGYYSFSYHLHSAKHDIREASCSRIFYGRLSATQKRVHDTV